MSDRTPRASARPPLLPADTPDYMVPAWDACMRWAFGQPELFAQFRAETMRRHAPGSMDEAEAFVRWANVAVWGPM